MRHGITILPEHPWREAAPMWRAVEEMGFAHAWTYDHLVWGGLPAHPWYGAIPTLTAAATVTERIALGTFVTSPNFRHPYVLARDVLALDDVSGGRFRCGLGSGGDLDAGILGTDLTVRERVDRFVEFTRLLDRLLREDDVDHDGEHFTTRGARTLPGPVRARVPFVLAANGPRAIRLAAELGQGWVTYGGRGDTLEAWFAHCGELARRFDDALAATGREDPVDRYLSLDSSPRFSLESAGLYAEMAGRAGELGFTDVVTHWPRSSGPYAGDVAVLEEVAAEVVGPSHTGP